MLRIVKTAAVAVAKGVKKGAEKAAKSETGKKVQSEAEKLVIDGLLIETAKGIYNGAKSVVNSNALHRSLDAFGRAKVAESEAMIRAFGGKVPPVR